MAMSQKRKKRVLDEVGVALLETLHAEYPSTLDGPPDTWSKEEKQAFDTMSILEHNVCANLQKLMMQW